MGILGNLFGNSEEDGYSDFGTRLALAGQVLSALDQGQVANLGPSIAELNAQRRKYMAQAKTNKWMQSQAAAMADKNPRLAQVLQDAPPEIGASIITKYLQTLPEFQLPDWKTFDDGQGNIMRYDANNPNSKPEVFFDGPEDPFKTMISGILRGGAPQGVESVTPPGAPPAETSPAPGDGGMPPAPETSLPPMLKAFADAYGLPPDVSPTDVMSIAQAGALGGKEQAAATAEAIRKRYADENTNKFNLTKQQADVAFKLQDDYYRVGQNYQKIIDTATEMSNLPDDPNGFERVMTLYKYMRALDPLGAVRESDAALAQSASGPYARLEQLFEQYGGMSGSEIPRDAAIEMKRLILQMGETANKADYKARQKTIRRGEALGLPKEKIDEMVFGALQDSPDLLEGYSPRFEVPERPAADPSDPAAEAAAQPAPIPPGTPQVRTKEDYDRLQSGDAYVDPNGVLKRKR